MTVIDRTAYPRFKSQPTAKELADLYTPTSDEIAFVQSHTSNSRACYARMALR
ncbi:MAG: hypothetical protein CLLPBCKN_001570 [Chroococcidiopsis cubana SAG 39.79]|uniref:DUF4158 domain-containing protein n=1 Tax=Chroococcidiopsis cubana TaxID=171392 RepID=UPI000F8EA327|nr:hypothetical protein [Chroococcidiopsis cubana SAG 39.79]